MSVLLGSGTRGRDLQARGHVSGFRRLLRGGYQGDRGGILRFLLLGGRGECRGGRLDRALFQSSVSECYNSRSNERGGSSMQRN